MGLGQMGTRGRNRRSLTKTVQVQCMRYGCDTGLSLPNISPKCSVEVPLVLPPKPVTATGSVALQAHGFLLWPVETADRPCCVINLFGSS